VAFGQEVGRSLQQAFAEITFALGRQCKWRRQQLPQGRLGAQRGVNGITLTSPSSASDWMVRDRSRMKQADKAAHSSGLSGGDNRVLDFPAIGVLQIIATATVFAMQYLSLRNGSGQNLNSAR